MLGREGRLDYYTNGTFQQKPEIHAYKYNNSLRDNSNSIIERNFFSLNSKVYDQQRNAYKKLNTLKSVDSAQNNYISPVRAFQSLEKSNGSPIANYENYQIEKRKIYNNDKYNDVYSQIIPHGTNLNQNDYFLKKSLNNRYEGSPQSLAMSVNLSRDPNVYSDSEMKINRTKVSGKSPDWFHVYNTNTIKQTDEELVNRGESLNFLSCHQGWITLTPRSKNRNKPLELDKIVNMEQPSKVTPYWMISKHQYDVPLYDPLKKNFYKDLRDGHKFTILSDKDPDQKSIFNFGDYRHNVMFKDELDRSLKKQPLSNNQTNLLEWRYK